MSHKTEVQKEAGGLIPDIMVVTNSHPHQGISGEKDLAKIPHSTLERVSFIQLLRIHLAGKDPLPLPLLPPSSLNLMKGNTEASSGEPETTLRQAGQPSRQVLMLFIFVKRLTFQLQN